MPVELPAAPLFWPAQLHFPIGGEAQSMAIGDLNGDQQLDLVVTTDKSTSGGVAAVLIGAGDGTFGRAHLYEAGQTPQSVATSDLNGDGALDFVVANQSSDDVSVHLGEGDGTFVAASFYNAGDSPSFLAIGNLNGDDVPDLVVSNLDSDAVSVLLGAGDGQFGTPRSFAVGSGPSSVAISDLNGDQLADLVVGNSLSNDVTILVGDGHGVFGASALYALGYPPQSLAIADLNGDQLPDVAAACFSRVAVLLGIGDGTFGTTLFWTGNSNAHALVIQDLNDDRLLDLVVSTSDGLVVLIGAGDGTFPFLNFYASVGLGLGARDLNGDKVPDLVLAENWGVAVFLGLGDGTFGVAPLQGRLFQSLKLGDLNGDQVLDVAGADYFSTHVAVQLGVGDGTFGRVDLYESGQSPRSVVIVDMDRDRIPDLVVANEFNAAVLLGTGDGTFGAPTVFEPGPDYDPQDLAISDLNRDEVPDLAVRNTRNVSVFLGTGDGTFSWTALVYEGNPSALAIGDLNGDEVPDLAVADESVAVIIGIGDGTFGSAALLWAGEALTDLAIGDLNGDQVPDLAVADLLSEIVTVFLGIGGGAFGEGRVYRAGNEPRDLEIGDLNGDQMPDLVVVGRNVAVLVGEGDGTFGTTHFYGAEPRGPYSVAIGDLNRDQVLDLALGSSGISQGFFPIPILLGFRTPEITADEVLSVPTVTVGDTVSVDLIVSNHGLTRAPITNVTFSWTEMRLGVPLPLHVDPGASLAIPVLLEPRRSLKSSGELRLFTISSPAISTQVEVDVRSLIFSSRRDPPEETVPWGQELILTVTPASQVRIERGAVRYSIRGIGGQFSVPLTPQGLALSATIPGTHVSDDGLAYYIEVENSGVFATDPPGAPDSTYAVRTTFSSVPLPHAGSRFLEGRAIQVVTNLSAIESGSLHYRPAGEREYSFTPIDTEQPIPVATIPDSIVGPRGVEYWMEIVRETEIQTDPPGSDPGSHPRTIQVTVAGLDEERDFAGAGSYRMVSVPLDFDRDIPPTLEGLLSDQSAFGPYDPTRWRAFRFAEAGSELRYVELSEGDFIEEHRVTPGRAFWLASRDAGRIDTAPITGTSTPTNRLFPLVLSPGWSQIGNPYLFPVVWDSILVEVRSDTISMAEAERAGQVEPPVAWRNQMYELDVQILDPFDGYWVRNLADTTVSLLIPPREAQTGVGRTQPAAPLARTADGWAIGITAAAAGAVDDANVAGVIPRGATAWDPADRSEPPLEPWGVDLSLLSARVVGEAPGTVRDRHARGLRVPVHRTDRRVRCPSA